MNKKLKIIVDMDAISADFLGGLLKAYNAMTGETAQISDVKT